MGIWSVTNGVGNPHEEAGRIMNTENQFANDLYCLSSAGFCVIPEFIPQKVVASLRRKADAWIKEVHVYEEMMGELIGCGSSWPLENIRCLYAIDTSFQELAMASRMHVYAAAYHGGI